MKIMPIVDKSISVRIQITEFHSAKRVKSKNITVYESNFDEVYTRIIMIMKNE